MDGAFADRKRGFARALAEVLGKLSGDRRAAEHPGVAAELGRAALTQTLAGCRRLEGALAQFATLTYITY